MLAVSLPAGQITTLTPPTAAAIGTAVSTDLLIGTQFAAASVPVALPTATITTLTPPTAAAIAAAIVANPPAVTFSAPQHVIVDSGTLTTVSTVTAVTSITNPVAVTGTFFQATQPVSIASGQVASGAFASGSIASGAIASGAIASGAIAAGAAAAGAFADGSVFVRSNAASTFPVTAIGTLTNNNAAPAGTNVGALTAIANAAAPSFSEGDQVLVSVDLSGHQRVVATGPAASGAAAAGNPVLVGGIDASGNIRQLPVANAGVGTLPTQTLIIGGKNYDSNGVIQAGFDGYGTISTINSVANGDAQSNTTGFLYASVQDTTGRWRFIPQFSTAQLGTVLAPPESEMPSPPRVLLLMQLMENILPPRLRIQQENILPCKQMIREVYSPRIPAVVKQQRKARRFQALQPQPP